MPDSHAVQFLRDAGTSILDQKHVIAVLPSLARRRFDAEIGRDPAEHNRANAPPPELQVEFGAVEGAPLVLGNDKVCRLGEPLRQRTPGRRQHTFGPFEGLIHALARRVGKILCEGDPGKRDERAGGAEPSRKCPARGQHLRARARRKRPADGAVLEVDENQGRCAGIEQCLRFTALDRDDNGLAARLKLAGRGSPMARPCLVRCPGLTSCAAGCPRRGRIAIV